MLSDRDLTKHLDTGRIRIAPRPSSDQMQPASVDVTLGSRIRVYRLHSGRPRRVWLDDIPDGLTTELDITSGYVLQPGEFILATTRERVTLPDDVCAFLHGRSTLGRLGLLVHVTAGLIDPGYDGEITLEVANVGDLELGLRPGQRIGQLTFEEMSSPCVRPYGSAGLGSHYQHQVGPTEPCTAAVAVESLSP